MGKSISYCYKCSSILREDDFLKGKAFQDGDRVVCAGCAPALRDSSTRIASKSTTKFPGRPPSPRLPSVRKPLPPGELEELEEASARRSKLPLLLGAGAGGVALVVVLVLVLGKRSAPAPPPPAPEKISRPVAPPPKEKPKKTERTADQELLESAKKFAASHADDFEGQIKEYEKLVWGEFEK